MKTLTLLLLTALLGACAGHLSDQARTVEQYYADDQLTAATLEACRARNDAELRAMAAKPACQNAREAERRHSQEAAEAWAREWNADMEALMRERKAAREAAGLALAGH